MRRPPLSNFLYACLPQPVLELLGREAGEGILFSVLAVDRHCGEQRDLPNGKALDLLQRQVHVRVAGHHADLEARPLVGDEDVALEGLFRQALLLIKGHLTAADHRLAGFHIQFCHNFILLGALNEFYILGWLYANGMADPERFIMSFPLKLVSLLLLFFV